MQYKLIMAMPTMGKSFLASRSSKFVDFDVGFFKKRLGYGSREKMCHDDELSYVSELLRRAGKGRIILSNHPTAIDILSEIGELDMLREEILILLPLYGHEEAVRRSTARGSFDFNERLREKFDRWISDWSYYSFHYGITRRYVMRVTDVFR